MSDQEHLNPEIELSPELSPDRQKIIAQSTRFLIHFHDTMTNRQLDIPYAYGLFENILNHAKENDIDVNDLHVYYQGSKIPLLPWMTKLTHREVSEELRGRLIDQLIGLGARVDEPDEEGCIALHHAARKKYPKLVKKLLNEGSDVNLQSDSQQTALHRAAKAGYTEIVNLLLEAKADLHIKDDQGFEALYYAVHQNAVETAVSLIDAGANVKVALPGTTANQGIDEADSLLHLSAFRGFVEMSEVLVGLGLDTHAKNSKGQTPLHKAMLAAQLGMVQFLIEKGADIDQKDHDGKSIMNIKNAWRSRDQSNDKWSAERKKVVDYLEEVAVAVRERKALKEVVEPIMDAKPQRELEAALRL